MDIARVVTGISRAVGSSFAADGSRSTRAEVTRRFEICLSLLELQCMDYDFSLSRGLNNLDRGLRARLDGSDWDPRPKSSTYLANAADDAGEPLLWTPDRQDRGVIVL